MEEDGQPSCNCVSSQVVAHPPSFVSSAPPAPSQRSIQPFHLCDSFASNGDCLVLQPKSIECPRSSSDSNHSQAVHHVCSCRCQHSQGIRFKRKSRVTCGSDGESWENSAPKFCELRVVAGGDVLVEGDVVIAVSTLVLNATSGGIQMDPGSAIDASAKGLLYRSSARAGLQGSGGSYGGIGGQAGCGAVGEDPGTTMIGYPDMPWHNWVTDGRDVLPSSLDGYGYGGSDPGGVSGGRGGGRVFLGASKNVTMNGRVLADGGKPPSGCTSGCGSGAGGTVVIIADSILGVANRLLPALTANGGDTSLTKSGAGGGGRIALLASRVVSLEGTFAIGAVGGNVNPAKLPSDVLCRSGAAGTIFRAYYDKSAGYYLGSLEVNNCVTGIPCSRKDFVSATTPLLYPYHVGPAKLKIYGGVTSRSRLAGLSLPPTKLITLQINKYATVNASFLMMDSPAVLGEENRDVLPGVFINAAKLINVATLKAPTLQLSSASYFYSQPRAKVEVTHGDFSVDPSSSCSFAGIAVVNVSKGEAQIEGLVQAQSLKSVTPDAETHLTFDSRGIVIAKGASVKADRVTLLSWQHVNISSAITATLIPKCTEIKSRRLCRNLIRENMDPSSLADELANYSLAVVMKQGQSKLRIDRDAGRLQARSIILCADDIDIAGEISTSGQGCLSDSGFGAGCSSSGSSGGGGGHGGRGDNGTSCFDGGRTYDSRSIPILSGSGGGSGLSGVNGGAGGGVVIIGGRLSVLLGSTAKIAADGTNGQDSTQGSGGGAGSGGSVVVESPALCRPNEAEVGGRAVISAEGGKGGEGGGGGGGGGRISIRFSMVQNASHPVKVAANACTLWGNFSADMAVVSVAGGRSPKVNRSLLHTSRNVRVDTRGQNGTVFSPACSSGHGGMWCHICPKGTYKDSFGPEPCQPCDPRDCIKKSTCAWMVRGAMLAECPVICNPGYILPDCVTPIEQLIANVGGIEVFIVAVVGFALVMFILFGCVCTQVEWCPGYYSNKTRLARQRMRTLRALYQHRHQVGLPGSSAGPLQDAHLPLLSPDLAHLMDRSDLSQSQTMSESDLPFHVARIYLGGDNTFGRPWMLEDDPPVEIREMVSEEDYKAMVANINDLAAVPFTSAMISFVLSWLCYPIWQYFIRVDRSSRANRLSAFFACYDYSCLRSARGRALEKLKFATDASATLAYIDVLSDSPSSQPVRFPTALLLAGDGSYTSPYLVDTSDIIVRAIPHVRQLKTFIDQEWVELIATLNAAIRPIQRLNIIHAIKPALRIVDAYNRSPQRLGGMMVSLGLFWPNGADVKIGLVLTAHPDLPMMPNPDDAEQRRTSSAVASVPFPPSLNDSVTSALSLSDDELSQAHKLHGRMAVEAFEHEERMRPFHAHRSLREEREEEEEEEREEEAQEEEESFSRVTTIRDKSLVLPSEMLSRRDISRADAEQAEEPEEEVKWLPFPGKILRVEEALLGRQGGSMPVSSLRELIGIMLNRVPPKAFSEANCRLCLLVALMADAFLTFWLLIVLWCVEIDHRCHREGFFMIISIYPAAIFFSLLYQATLVVFPLSGIGRASAAWIVLSCINVCVNLGYVLLVRRSLAVQDIILSAIWLPLKWLEAHLVDVYIALVETDRRRKIGFK